VKFGDGGHRPVRFQAIEELTEPLTWPSRGDIGGQSERSPRDDGGLLDSPFVDVGVGEPGQIQRLVSRMRVVVLGEGAFERWNGAGGDLQSALAASGHDLQFGLVYPARPIRVRLPAIATECLVGESETLLSGASVAGDSVRPRGALMEQGLY
jgi:hypothetical protein